MKAILWYNNKRCRVSEDVFKTLNESIVLEIILMVHKILIEIR
jgi:hypothetical protein